LIEKFNFYDIYGYFIPGAVLLAILYGPFIFTNVHPTVPLNEFSTVILAVIASYVTGHFIQSMATNAASSKFKGIYPSIRLLNPSDAAFTPALKEAIAAVSIDRFKIDPKISVDTDGTNKEIDSARDSAFRLARALTNARHSGTYAEQFQGLYSMMRGLATAFSLGFLYMLGWALSIWHYPCSAALAAILLKISLVVTIGLGIWRLTQGLQSSKCLADRIGLAALGGILLGGALLLAQSQTFNVQTDRIYWAMAAFYLAAVFRFYVSYEVFSNEFAKAVWIGFRVID
jgi:hypothetical protein